MYWLRWHYHVKDIAGAPYKITQKKNKTTESPTVSSRGQTTVILCSTVQSRSPSRCQTTTGKVESSARDGTSSATVRWQTTAGCSNPRTCRSHWEGTITECRTSGGRYHQHGWVSRAQTTAGYSTHVPKPLGRHGHRVSNVWWTVSPAWLSQQSVDGVCILLTQPRTQR